MMAPHAPTSARRPERHLLSEAGLCRVVHRRAGERLPGQLGRAAAARVGTRGARRQASGGCVQHRLLQWLAGPMYAAEVRTVAVGVTSVASNDRCSDPCATGHGGGVLTNLSDSVLAVIIPNGAHHIDLMFTDPADAGYPDILAAREFERAQMRKWVAEHTAQRRVNGA
eukprot:2261035-Prymnesium_polylepis.2